MSTLKEHVILVLQIYIYSQKSLLMPVWSFWLSETFLASVQMLIIGGYSGFCWFVIIVCILGLVVICCHSVLL